MNQSQFLCLCILSIVSFHASLSSAQVTSPLPVGDGSKSPYAAWSPSVLGEEEYFPIAVWLQAPRNAERYKKAGINLYVGLWRGPTEDQLQTLHQASMPVICAQNEVGLLSKFNKIIVGWMHGDEPDNAQAKRDGKGYDPPILPSAIVEDYQRLRQKDSKRPIFLNLGQGVAYDQYIGRGTRRNHPEDYAEYAQGSDIVSFDIYPAVHDKPEIAGKLEYVPRGVARLREWTKDQKIVWNCIECSRISNAKTKPTPDQIRSEVWMSLIQGSRGIIYFVHQFEPQFREASLLDDPELLPAVTEINRHVTTLAPVLNRGRPSSDVTASGEPHPAIQMRVLEHENQLYLFAVNLTATSQSIVVNVADRWRKGERLYEEGTIEFPSGRMEDTFKPYQVHLYRFR